MRFRIQDLLLLTTLIAIYLTACKYAYEWGNLRTRKYDILLYVFFMLTFVGFYVGLARLTLANARQKASLVEISLPLPVPWLSFFLMSFVTWLGALFTHISLVFLGVFLGSSIAFWGHVILVILNPKADLTTDGILYYSGLVPWKRVYPLRQADSLMTHLRLNNANFGPKVVVPEVHRQHIQSLIEASR